MNYRAEKTLNGGVVIINSEVETVMLNDGKYYKDVDIWTRFFVCYDGLKKKNFIITVGGDREVWVFYRPVTSSSFTQKTTSRFVPFPKTRWPMVTSKSAR